MEARLKRAGWVVSAGSLAVRSGNTGPSGGSLSAAKSASPPVRFSGFVLAHRAAHPFFCIMQLSIVLPFLERLSVDFTLLSLIFAQTLQKWLVTAGLAFA